MKVEKEESPQPQTPPPKKEGEVLSRVNEVINQFIYLLTVIPRLLWDLLMIIADLNDSTDRPGTIKDIKEGIKIKGYNVWILVASTMIACIGLDTNSAAVIIGAMLISPLMSPILGIGLSVGINDIPTLRDSVKNFGLAIAVSLVTSALYFWVSPLGDITPELEARTHPTFLDIGVAFFGGIAGIVASSRKEMTNAIPGVAIATALMPPLCTAGFGLANLNAAFFWGASYLFFLNSVFISLSTFLIVRFLKFPLVTEFDSSLKQRFTSGIVFAVLLVSVPSMYLLYDLVVELRTKNQTKLFLEDKFEKRANCDVVDWEMIERDSVNILKVTLAGDHIPDTVTTQLNAELKNYHLDRTQLYIIQTDIDPETISELNAGLGTVQDQMRGYYEMFLSEVHKKQSIVDSLEWAMQVHLSDTIPFHQINKELKGAYPELASLTMAYASSTDFESEVDTIPFIMVSWKKGTNRYRQKDYEKRILAYTQTRLDLDTLVLISR